MARAKRITHGALVYHVFNRAVRETRLFHSSNDFDRFRSLLGQTRREMNVRVLAYCLMPNHWHLLLWPVEDNVLSSFVHRLTAIHAAQWNRIRGLTGRGAVYQSRFRSVPVQDPRHLLTVWRYVERNALSAGLVRKAEAWPWCSLADRARGAGIADNGPMGLPENWLEIVNAPQSEADLLDGRAD